MTRIRAWWMTRSDIQQRNAVVIAFALFLALVVAVVVIVDAA